MGLVHHGLMIAVSVVVLSVKPVRNMLSPSQMMNFSFNPLHLVNTYLVGVYFPAVTLRANESNRAPSTPDTELAGTCR